MTLGILEVWRGHANMALERVADMTIEELKAVIAEVVAQQSKSQNFDAATENVEMPKQLPDRAPETNQKVKTSLPHRTKAEQRARNLAVIELLHEWREEGNEEEERESFENLKRALDEDRLSDRPLFPHK
jgi:transcriptional regulator with AAA-type ATPase domain